MPHISRRMGTFVLLAGTVAATLTTSYIHYTLGGLLFLLNALDVDDDQRQLDHDGQV